MDSTLQVQARIRHNAEEMSSYLSDMYRWEKQIETKDKKMRKSTTKKTNPVPRRKGYGTVHTTATSLDSVDSFSSNEIVAEQNNSNQMISKSSTAAHHTYDIGYKKWEKWNDEEQGETENVKRQTERSEVSKENEQNYEREREREIETEREKNRRTLTPASLVAEHVCDNIPTPVPRALGEREGEDVESRERERGNEAFRKGEFATAVKIYTKCLGLKSRNYIAFSNRAMAYLRLRENLLAESDCTTALSLSPSHVKSLVRRASARSALGKHRLAVRDLMRAREIDPSSKSIISDLEREREILRSVVKNAPLMNIRINSLLERDKEIEKEGEREKENEKESLIEGPEVPVNILVR